jgi:hypothetical protein
MPDGRDRGARRFKERQMNRKKMLGSVLGAAVVLLAAFGAGSASATVLCKTNANPCLNHYVAPEVITANATNVKLTTTPNVICTSSKLEYEIQNPGSTESHVSVHVKTLSFNLCRTEPSMTHNCTVATIGTPFGGEVVLGTTPNGTLTVFSPEISVKCPGTIDCFYGNMSPTLAVTGGEFPVYTATAQKLTKTKGTLCPAGGEVKWDATFNSTIPVWVRAGD